MNEICEKGKDRSIPAGAGEPSGRPSRPCSGWVYPRGCGGAVKSCVDPMPIVGLSPRVRGSRYMDTDPVTRTRSIPAGAGEPQR